MKLIFRLVLMVSLLANVALLGVLVAAKRGPAAGPASPAVGAPAERQVAPSPGELWTALQSDDLPEYATRLREAGFPPHVVRALVRQRIEAQFAERRKALDEGSQNEAFWKVASLDPRRTAARRALAREEAAALRAVLGDEAADGMQATYESRGLGGVAPEKKAQVREVMRELNDRRSDLFAAGTVGPGGQQELRALEKAARDKIAAILSPAEMQQYELATSRTAESMRLELSVFNATEAEFKAVYEIRRAFEDRLELDRAAFTPETARQREVAQREMNEQIKLALGAERAAEYERATDYSYRQTSQLVARLELPAETAGQLYAIQKEFQQRRQEVGKGATSREEMMARMQALQQEALTKVTPLLGGERGVTAYKRYGGQWIENLVPRMSPARPAATH
ncbi:hypothetical protein [Opitutus sp. ER46]|uniref:hypothetical protein n=1 Tax=Opitutus sp. ER46 TaxID=2161864 RepID=UPI000D31060C|nr:hypothetical protein [Opitutus sp. ER46]PTY01156.1 hypothetical protein DB354_00495 [Opitutus sp. ER46]